MHPLARPCFQLGTLWTTHRLSCRWWLRNHRDFPTTMFNFCKPVPSSSVRHAAAGHCCHMFPVLSPSISILMRFSCIRCLSLMGIIGEPFRRIIARIMPALAIILGWRLSSVVRRVLKKSVKPFYYLKTVMIGSLQDMGFRASCVL